MDGRLLDCTLGDPYSNVALEEAIFIALDGPVLRLWDNQKSVVVGRAQLPASETDLELCRLRSIPVVRRFTAGGTIYNGPGNLNWSFFEKREKDGAIFDSSRVFARIGAIVVRALGSCSVNAEFEPPNRICSREGKISGMAAYASSVGVVCHGTLLIGADLKEVAELTRPSVEPLPARYPRSRVASIANCAVKREEFKKSLLKASGTEYSPDQLTSEEREVSDRLMREKYSKSEWNLGDPFA
jgi:lipoate-protein ligase A